MKIPSALAVSFFAASATLAIADSGNGWITYPAAEGPGAGKHIVLLAGDEEYRSEEALPMLGKILSQRHGFKCTVLFSADDDGTINPNRSESVGRPETLDSADAIIMSLRFRKWSPEAMKHLDDAVNRGIPIIGLRTSTHAFQLPGDHPFARYNQFGKNVLGENWVSHWGRHKAEGTRGVNEPDAKDHPILNSVADVFGDTDVYEAYPPEDAKILMRGQVTAGLTPDSKPASYEKNGRRGAQNVNDPMMPVAWVREVENAAGTTNKVFCTTLGSSTDFLSEDLRRLVINSVYWGLGMDVPAKADATTVGEFKPSAYDFNGFRKGTKASDHAIAE